MNLLARTFIGTVRESKTSIVSYTVLECYEDGSTRICSYPQGRQEIKAIQAGARGYAVAGLGDSNGKLAGTNGSIDRYPIVDITGRLVSNNAVVIVGTSGNKYLCSDYRGTVLLMTEKEVIAFAEMPGNNIANGKIVTKGTSKFVSAITGTYPEIKLPNTADDSKVPDKMPATEEEAIQEIKKGLNMVAKEVIRRGYGVRDYEAVGDAMKETGIVFRYQMKDKKNFEKVVNVAIDLFKKGVKAQ